MNDVYLAKCEQFLARCNHDEIGTAFYCRVGYSKGGAWILSSDTNKRPYRRKPGVKFTPRCPHYEKQDGEVFFRRGLTVYVLQPKNQQALQETTHA